MKMNIIHVTCEFQKAVSADLQEIDEAESFEEARITGAFAIGRVNGYVVMMNCMVCSENNDITPDMDRQCDRWYAEIYDHMANKAVEANQTAYAIKYYRHRDELLAGLNDEDE